MHSSDERSAQVRPVPKCMWGNSICADFIIGVCCLVFVIIVTFAAYRGSPFSLPDEDQLSITTGPLQSLSGQNRKDYTFRIAGHSQIFRFSCSLRQWARIVSVLRLGVIAEVFYDDQERWKEPFSASDTRTVIALRVGGQTMLSYANTRATRESYWQHNLPCIISIVIFFFFSTVFMFTSAIWKQRWLKSIENQPISEQDSRLPNNHFADSEPDV